MKFQKNFFAFCVKRLGICSFGISIFLITALLNAFCGKKEADPVYAGGRNALIQGSLYYNEAGCAFCHGIQFDGKGPEAKTFAKENGFAVPGFRRELAAGKSPLDYFKTITMGTPRYKSHAYQPYTDKGRWAMARYLYSLSAAPKTREAQYTRRRTLLAMERKLKEVYAKNRRWEMGYTPLDQRPASPKIKDLLPKKK